MEKLRGQLEKNRGEYLVVTHPDWIGVGNVAKDNFENILKLKEIENEEEAKRIAEVISSFKYRIIVFNGLAIGWNVVARYLKKINQDTKIKLIWHRKSCSIV